ncbi:MAG: sugar phosphate isomerase/epimerase family protein [Armatimonadota bacterium]
MNRIGCSGISLAGRSLPEGVSLALERGFRAFEVLAFDGYHHSAGPLAGYYFEHMSTEEREKLRDLLSRFTHLTTHAPFLDMAPFAPNPSLRETAQRQLRLAVESAAYLGASNTTTHVVPRLGRILADFREDLIDLYRRLGDQAAAAGITVTIETGYPGEIETFAQLVWDINHPAVGATVDVGHLLGTIPAQLVGTPEGATLYQVHLETHLNSLGRKLYHLHAHDVDPVTLRDHHAIGRGFLDWGRIAVIASDLGFEGLFMLELEEPDVEQALVESKAALEAVLSA